MKTAKSEERKVFYAFAFFNVIKMIGDHSKNSEIYDLFWGLRNRLEHDVNRFDVLRFSFLIDVLKQASITIPNSSTNSSPFFLATGSTLAEKLSVDFSEKKKQADRIHTDLESLPDAEQALAFSTRMAEYVLRKETTDSIMIHQNPNLKAFKNRVYLYAMRECLQTAGVAVKIIRATRDDSVSELPVFFKSVTNTRNYLAHSDTYLCPDTVQSEFSKFKNEMDDCKSYLKNDNYSTVCAYLSGRS